MCKIERGQLRVVSRYLVGGLEGLKKNMIEVDRAVLDGGSEVAS